MSHYECSDCGYSMGVSYGFCSNCTPKEVLEAGVRLKDAEKVAEAQWDEEMKDLKQRFIKDETDSLKKVYEILFNIHSPKNR